MTDLDGRYGTSKRTHRLAWSLVAFVGIAVGVAFSAWVAIDNQTSYRSEVLGFGVESQTHTWVEFIVYREEPIALTCRVYAQAEDKQIVGETSVDVPASSDKNVKVRVDIRTERLATTGSVRDCTPQ